MRANYSVDNDDRIYRGIVVENQDPQKLGRIKVRIKCFHGERDEGIPDEDLPWATLCMVGASYQSGMYIVPEINSTVFVVFENGNHASPIVLGSSYSRGTQDFRYLGQSPTTGIRGDEGVFTTTLRKLFGSQPSGRVVPAFQTDLTDEARLDTSTKIVYRSPKGAQIMMKDRDGGETLEITDANGQMLKFYSPMESKQTKDNQHLRTAPKKNLLNKARTILTNALGQGLSIIADGDAAEMNLVDTLRKMGVEISSYGDYVRVFHQGGSKVELSVRDGSVALVSEGAIVKVSGSSVTIKGSSINIEGSKVSVNGSNLGLAGNIGVNGPINSNSSIRGGLSNNKASGPAPSFSGTSNNIENWTEGV